MYNLRKDFPIFASHPDLVFLDNASTTQKPATVIDGMAEYLRNDYANIHRGAYELSERSELLYELSKSAVAKLIGAESAHEIIYTANSTAAANLLAFSLARSGWLVKGDRVLLSAVEHHANIVPWLMLKESIGIEVDFFEVLEDFSIDFEDLAHKATSNTKVISTTFASNVTGAIFDIDRVAAFVATLQIDRADLPFSRPLLVVDASQALPNFEIKVQDRAIDFCFFTGHKMMADAGIGVLYGRKSLLKSLTPSVGGGGAINFVHRDGFEHAGLPFRFEPGTPNMTGAVSMLRAIEYFEKIGGYATVREIEQPLIAYALERFAKLSPRVRLIGPVTPENRVGVFSFMIDGMHANDIADALAESEICIRSGHHCTQPLHERLGITASARMSLYLYTTQTDIDTFFEVLEDLLDNLD